MENFKLQLHPNGVTLVLPEADKANGLRIIAKHGRVSPAELLYVGDAIPDMKCLELAGFAACPANAHETVKKLVLSKGGYVSELSTLEGSLDIIRNYLPKANAKSIENGGKGLYCAVFDFDGCLFDRAETLVRPGQRKFVDSFRRMVKNSQGPFTSLPFITINTGASIGIFRDYEHTNSFGVFDAYGFTAESIPGIYHKTWPPIMFEDGLVRYDPIACEKDFLAEEAGALKLMHTLKQELSRHLMPEIKAGSVRIPSKEASLSVDFQPGPCAKGTSLEEFQQRMVRLLSSQGKSLGFEFKLIG